MLKDCLSVVYPTIFCIKPLFYFAVQLSNLVRLDLGSNYLQVVR